MNAEVERLHARFREQAKHLETAAGVAEAKAKALIEEARILRAVVFYVDPHDFEALRKYHAVMQGGKPWTDFCWAEDGIGAHPVMPLPGGKP